MAGKTRSIMFAIVACLVAWQPQPGNSVFGEDQVSQIIGRTMGTTYLVKFQFKPSLPEDQKPSIESLQGRIDQRLLAINQSMSTYIADSEISRFNKLKSDSRFEVSKDFLAVANRALEINQLTLGRFDVTVGPLVRFWGFGGGTVPDRIPSTGQIQQVLKRIGSKNIVLDESAVRKKVSELEVDFSAIAKGYAVDEICKIMREFSENYMVEIGGEVRTAGSNPKSDKSWTIGVELPASGPLAGTGDLAARIELSDRALATSGDYRNFVLIEDKRFQHTIDPTTGFPVDQGILSVSVQADDCMTADGMATGLMVLPLDQIKRLCNDNQIATFVIFKNQNGDLDWWKSDSFAGEVLMGKPVSGKGQESSASTNPIYLVLGTIVVFGLAISGMAVGVILSNRQLKGSCGGLSAMNQNGDADASPCSLCTKPVSECSRRSGQNAEEPAAVE